MPIYEYQCKKCDARFEALVRGSETLVCPECGGRKLEKLLSSFSAHDGASKAVPCGGDVRCCDAGACPSGQCPLGG